VVLKKILNDPALFFFLIISHFQENMTLHLKNRRKKKEKKRKLSPKECDDM
jgi:hypothetical protein